MRRLIPLLLVALTCTAPLSHAQNYAVVDIAGSGFSVRDGIPFHVPVLVRIDVDSIAGGSVGSVDSVYISRAASRELTLPPNVIEESAVEDANWYFREGKLYVKTEELKPSRYYVFGFRYLRVPTESERQSNVETIKRELAGQLREGRELDRLLESTLIIAENIADIAERTPSGERLLDEQLLKESFAILSGMPSDPATDPSGEDASVKRIEAFPDARPGLADTLEAKWSAHQEAAEALEITIGRAASSIEELSKQMSAPESGVLTTYNVLLREFASNDAYDGVEEVQDHLSTAALAFAVANAGERSMREVASGLQALDAKVGSFGAATGELDAISPSPDFKRRLQNLKSSEENLLLLLRFVERTSQLPVYRRHGPDVDLSKFRPTLRTTMKNVHGVWVGMGEVAVALDELQAAIAEVASGISREDPKWKKEEGMTSLTTAASFKTRSRWYVSADAGLLRGFVIKETLPYLGVNVYPFGLNKDAYLPLLRLRKLAKFSPLKKESRTRESRAEASKSLWRLRRRLSFSFGATIGSVEEEGVRDGLVGGRALLLGVGFRLNDYLRFSSGVLLFEADDHSNPLVTRFSPAYTSYLSLALDWDVSDTIGGLGKLLFGQ